jgi:hypothetical protein
MSYPKGERVWLRHIDGHGQTRYIITSPPDRRVYKLYTPEEDGGWKLWGKDASAGKLADRFMARRSA